MYEIVTRTIERYLSVSDTDYAILLTGEWGCGKTYYVEHDLLSSLKKGGYSVLYASLHGVSCFDQVNTQLMLSKLENIKGSEAGDARTSYWMARFVQDVKESSNFWVKLLHSVWHRWHEKSIRKASRISRDSTVLVIDDLERSVDDQALREVLGFVYEQYIRRGYHVILVCDETKFARNSLYLECKEKYVRRTIDICQLQGSFVLEFAKSRCAKPEWLYAAIQSELEKFLRSKRVTNLRTVAMIVDGLVEVVVGLGEDFSKQYIASIFESLIPLLHAVSKGLLVLEDLNDNALFDELANIPMFYGDAEKRKSLDGRTLKACRFYDEYCCSLGHFYVFIRPLLIYALTGCLDVEQVRRDILSAFGKEQTAEAKVLARIRSYWTEEETVLLDAIERAVGFLNEGKYSLGEIVDIYACFCGIKNDTYVSDWPYPEDLAQMFLRFIDVRIKRDGQCPSREEIASLDLKDSFYRDTRVDMRPLFGRLRERYQESCQKESGDRINKLFQDLMDGCRQVEYRLAHPEDGRWSLFEDMDATDRISDVPRLPVFGLKYIEHEARKNILEITNSADFAYGQVASIRKLIDVLTDHIHTADDTKSHKARILDLVGVLQESIKHMDDYLAEKTQALACTNSEQGKDLSICDGDRPMKCSVNAAIPS